MKRRGFLQAMLAVGGAVAIPLPDLTLAAPIAPVAPALATGTLGVIDGIQIYETGGGVLAHFALPPDWGGAANVQFAVTNPCEAAGYAYMSGNDVWPGLAPRTFPYPHQLMTGDVFSLNLNVTMAVQ